MNKLRDYQIKGLQDIFQAWQENDVLMYVNGTGLGKTRTFCEVARQFINSGKRVMVIAHRTELITQTWRTLYTYGIHSGVIMSGYMEKFDIPCQVASIQTIIRRAKLPPCDLIIIDEAHRITADNSYAGILKKYNGAKFLFVTATCWRMSGQGFRHIVPGKETQLILNYNLSEGIEHGWLTPLKYLVMPIPDLSKVAIVRGDYDEAGSKKAMSLAPIVDSYKEHVPGKQGIFFSVNVEHSREIVDKYNAAGIPAAHIDGTTDCDLRAKLISDYDAGMIKVLSNCAIFTEGTDFKNCEFIQLGAPTKSLARMLQQIGRGTRPVPGLVDLYETAAERKQAIANSTKPYCTILDNAGVFNDHLDVFINDFYINWQEHFNGRKRDKKAIDEQIDILVFIAEDSAGNRHRFTDPKEIEGMRLIEVTKEARKKIIDYNAVKEFERLYGIFRHQHKERPGITAVSAFTKHCDTHRILITDEIWLHIYKRLVTDIQEKKDELYRNRARFPHSYPEHQFNKLIADVERYGIPISLYHRMKSRYEQDNMSEVLQHRFLTTSK